MNSLFGKLNVKDFIKATLLAAIVVIIDTLSPVFSSGQFPTLSAIGSALWLGAKAAGAYILKNLFTNSEGKFAKKES
jgi:hypothetical protein